MKLHFLQHVQFEGPGIIAKWAKDRDIPVSRTAFFLDEALPSMDSFDLLVIMGGPMGAYDEDKYTWLNHEKDFIRDAIHTGKSVLGICLGAQLIAGVLGARVQGNRHKEIGWFQINRNFELSSRLNKIFPEKFVAFHWHGDTFDIPKHAIPIGESDACKNQGFIYDSRVMALQFHLETTRVVIEGLIKNCGDELVAGQFIQEPDLIRQDYNLIKESNRLMYNVLEYFISLSR